MWHLGGADGFRRALPDLAWCVDVESPRRPRA